MDAKSLFLTANADTVYFVGFLDLTKGRWCWRRRPRRSAPSTTCGSAGSSTSACPVPIAARAASTCILPPGYDGPLPEGGFFVARARTTRVVWSRPRRSWRTRTIRSRRSSRSGSSPRSIPTKPAASARRIAEFLDRQGQARPDHAAAADRVPRRQRQGDEHHSAQRLQLLRDAQRGRAAGAGHLARPRADGAARRHRHRQGQAVCARCADEEDPDRSGRARQRHLAQPVHESARSELVLLPRLGVVQLRCSSPATSSRRRSR